MLKKINLPRISLKKTRKTILIVLVVLMVFASGYFLGFKGVGLSFRGKPSIVISRESPAIHQDTDFSLFWRVWDILEKDYFDKTKINYSEMIYGAIKGMVSALGDPYTSFLPPKENKIVEEDLGGSFEGVGIQIGYKGQQLSVITPLPGSPAEEAGIQAGDFIVGIIDEEKDIDRGTVGISLSEAVELIRGPEGSKVTLAILRDGANKPLVIEVARAKIDVPTLISTVVADGEIAHIKLLRFGGETPKEWQKVVREVIKEKKIKGVILDLRGNPGGYMDGAVDIASEFVDNNSVIVVEERSGGYEKEYKTSRFGLLTKTPLVILINQGSASASEILAGALRDIKEITIIGQTSFGKGTIQEPRSLENGSGLHITVARWITPSGHWVNEQGIEPDVKIEDDLETSQDEQLEKAIEMLKQQWQ